MSLQRTEFTATLTDVRFHQGLRRTSLRIEFETDEKKKLVWWIPTPNACVASMSKEETQREADVAHFFMQKLWKLSPRSAMQVVHDTITVDAKALGKDVEGRRYRVSGKYEPFEDSAVFVVNDVVTLQ